jgi:hypothetical protein
MTLSDSAAYLKPLDWKNLATYFASRRVLGSVSWEAPALGGSPHGLYLQGLGQFDLNGTDDWLHAQYLSLRFLFSPLPVFSINAGGVLELAEQADADTQTALALLVSADWHPPSAMQDTVSLEFRWGSGGADTERGGIGPFIPVMSISQGNVLNSVLSGLMILRAAYALRPHETLSLALDARYFLLDNDAANKALGGELYGSMRWAPVMETMLELGGGVFFPGTGNALPSDAPPQWLFSAALTISF